jgi:hypothetical protein
MSQLNLSCQMTYMYIGSMERVNKQLTPLRVHYTLIQALTLR